MRGGVRIGRRGTLHPKDGALERPSMYPSRWCRLMQRFRRLALLLVLGACEGGPFGTSPDDAQPLIIRPGSLGLAIGDSVQLSAFSSGSAGAAPIAGVTWLVSHPEVATVDPSGMLRALADGHIEVTARSGGRSGRTTVMVNDQLWALRVLPETVDLFAGSTRAAYAQYRRGAVGDYPWQPGELEWSVSDSSIATIDSGGTVRGIRPGEVTVTARAFGREASRPARVLPSIVFDSISVGRDHTCGLTTDGRAACWGDAERGAVGTETAPVHCDQYGCSAKHAPAPLPVDGPERFSAVAAGPGGPFSAHSCGLDETGKVFCWGSNDYGQLARPPYGPCPTSRTGFPCSPTPVPVAPEGTFVGVAVGRGFTCALSTDGETLCWGATSGGRTGQPDPGEENDPMPRPLPGGTRFVAIALGAGHGCGIDADGRAHCWGTNRYGELGLGAGDALGHPVPAPVAGELRFRSLAAGPYLTCGITSANETYCWGSAVNEVVRASASCPGVSTEPAACAPAPTRVALGVSLASITVGEDHACGVTASASAYCWGRNDRGQLGTGSVGGVADDGAPVEVSGGMRWRVLSAGGTSTCGISLERVAYCWGWNGMGKLGIGTTAESVAVPTRVLGQGE